MIPLVAALLVPSLFWDQGPDTAELLLKAQITHIAVPASVAPSWKSITGVSIEVVNPAQFSKVPEPSLIFRAHEASATRAPWVSSNGWRFLREPEGRFYCDAAGSTASLAAAEAFAFGVKALIHTDNTGLSAFGRMQALLARLDGQDMPALVNIGFVDDGSTASGEFMNLLVRRNLLFKVVKKPDPQLDLTVGLDLPGYPRAEAANPSVLAEKVRSALGDDKRLLRIYGTEVVIGRLFGNGSEARLFLINYGAGRSAVHGLRVRVAGVYRDVSAVQDDMPGPLIQDVSHDSSGTEFTLPELKTFAIINLIH